MTSIAARPVEAAASAEIATAIPTAAWKTLRVSHSSHRPDGDDDKLIQPSTESGEGHLASARNAWSTWQTGSPAQLLADSIFSIDVERQVNSEVCELAQQLMVEGRS